MKRLFSLFLSLLFLTVSTGFTGSVHVCKGIKQEVRLFQEDHNDKVCPVCALKNKQKAKKHNCCKHQAEQFKLSEKASKNSAQQSLVKFSGEAVLYQSAAVTFEGKSALTAQNVSSFYFPTPLKSPPLYVLHCVYRI
ncbi:HYC_CC_PP family protein [Pedobacter nyackensis]|uniref:HYC_CC_PP family protein n=1 Tax=Pedobacter nyackensis TaxID=475255 RepID=UPI0029318FC5|nr:hypothetical protein [Pedobacter nyackensis]